MQVESIYLISKFAVLLFNRHSAGTHLYL